MQEMKQLDANSRMSPPVDLRISLQAPSRCPMHQIQKSLLVEFWGVLGSLLTFLSVLLLRINIYRWVELMVFAAAAGVL